MSKIMISQKSWDWMVKGLRDDQIIHLKCKDGKLIETFRFLLASSPVLEDIATGDSICKVIPMNYSSQAIETWLSFLRHGKVDSTHETDNFEELVRMADQYDLENFLVEALVTDTTTNEYTDSWQWEDIKILEVESRKLPLSIQTTQTIIRMLSKRKNCSVLNKWKWSGRYLLFRQLLEYNHNCRMDNLRNKHDKELHECRTIKKLQKRRDDVRKQIKSERDSLHKQRDKALASLRFEMENITRYYKKKEKERCGGLEDRLLTKANKEITNLETMIECKYAVLRKKLEKEFEHVLKLIDYR